MDATSSESRVAKSARFCSPTVSTVIRKLSFPNRAAFWSPTRLATSIELLRNFTTISRVGAVAASTASPAVCAAKDTGIVVLKRQRARKTAMSLGESAFIGDEKKADCYILYLLFCQYQCLIENMADKLSSSLGGEFVTHLRN